VGEQEHVREVRGFGSYLRRVREERKLSLDSVEEMSFGFPERVTKSHLSRIENGLAVPSFPRMFTLSQIYGIPVSLMADRFEMELKRGMAESELRDKSDEELLDAAAQLRQAGRYPETLTVIDVMLERHASSVRDEDELSAVEVRLRSKRIQCLIHLGRYRLAKEECEELLAKPLPHDKKIETLISFATCCLRLERYTVASMALEHAASEIEVTGPHRLAADLEATRGAVRYAMADYRAALECHKRALSTYDQLHIPFETCRMRINVSSSLIELGSLDEAKKVLLMALEEAEQAGFDRQRALALSNFALLSYKLGDEAATEAYCIRSNSIARPREYVPVVFRNCYYLWKIAQRRGDPHSQKANERTLKAYLGRLEERLAEASAFRASLYEGGAR
jgi:tetratricopeptide (TPR) repeat protein